MRDTTKLPKWAQAYIDNLESNQSKTEQGAVVQNCHVGQNAFKQDENFKDSVAAIAQALGKNADALNTLAASIKPERVNAEFGPAVSLSDVRHS